MTPNPAGGTEEGACDAISRQEVIVALRRIPARQREAVVLRYWADLPEAEIAALMGVTVSGTSPRRYRAARRGRAGGRRFGGPGGDLGPGAARARLVRERAGQRAARRPDHVGGPFRPVGQGAGSPPRP